MKPLRIGSRGSRLALWQANHVRGRLLTLEVQEVEIVVIKTSGDQFAQAPIGQLGLKGVFVKELEDALLDGRVDLVVHSMKDVPTATPRGLDFPAICKREDPRDCVISRSQCGIKSLPRGARVGTSSLRRHSQLRYLRPDFEVADLRGNIDTRLRKLGEGQYDAIVLARAGLDRLGWADQITEILSPDMMMPAVGQGALGIEIRDDCDSVRSLVEKFDDAEARTAVTAERGLLAALEGGCQVPLGAWGRMENRELVLDACVLPVDGSERIAGQERGSSEMAAETGRRLAARLLDAGANRILKQMGRAIGRS